MQWRASEEVVTATTNARRVFRRLENAPYPRHDLFVLASVVASDGDRDGIPVVLMEAGSFSLPIVSTQVSGVPEMVRHGQTGWLVPPDDAAALSDAIAALAKDPEVRARLGQNARALIEAEFSIQRNASRLVALFQDICQLEDPNDQGEDRACMGDLIKAPIVSGIDTSLMTHLSAAYGW